MGIRIRKMLGYALTDVVEGDTRVNWKSPLLTYEPELTLEVFLGWKILLRSESPPEDLAAAVKTLSEGWIYKSAERELAACVQHDSEYGLPNVLLVRPVEWKDWYRYDDTIDYVEADDCEPHVKLLTSGIYPYNNRWMDARTSELLPWNDVAHLVRLKNDHQPGLPHPTDERIASLNDLFARTKPAVFTTWDEITRYLVPAPPKEVVDLAHFGELFTSPDVVQQLRPVVYTLWS